MTTGQGIFYSTLLVLIWLDFRVLWTLKDGANIRVYHRKEGEELK